MADIAASTRLYRSGNPFKRPCPLVAFAHTRAEFDATVEGYEAFSAESTSKPEGKGAKGKMTAAQANQYKRALKSKEDEKKLAEELRELIPGIEKEEQVRDFLLICLDCLLTVSASSEGEETSGGGRGIGADGRMAQYQDKADDAQSRLRVRWGWRR